MRYSFSVSVVHYSIVLWRCLQVFNHSFSEHSVQRLVSFQFHPKRIGTLMNSVQTVCMGFTVRFSLKYWVVQDVDVKGHDRRSIIGSKLWQLHKELWGNREKQTENKFRRHLDVFTLMCRTYRLTSCVLSHSRRYCCAISSKLYWVMFVNVSSWQL